MNLRVGEVIHWIEPTIEIKLSFTCSCKIEHTLFCYLWYSLIESCITVNYIIFKKLSILFVACGIL